MWFLEFEIHLQEKGKKDFQSIPLTSKSLSRWGGAGGGHSTENKSDFLERDSFSKVRLIGSFPWDI